VVHVDPTKLKVIQEWPTPKSVGEVRSFHGLASFYRRFVPNFSTLASPLNGLVKKDMIFNLSEKQGFFFQQLKEKLTNAPILALPNFSKIFELECVAYSVGIGDVLLQGGHPIAYFSEKINGSSLNYLIDNVVVDAFKLILLIYNNFSIVKIVVNIIERVK